MTIWAGVTVVQKPADELVSLVRVKSHLRVDFDTDDALIAGLLKAAIARIDGPDGIGFAMLEQTWRRSMDCFPWCIHLRGAPIKAVTSIKYQDPDGVQQTLAPADYIVDLDSEPVRIEPAFGRSWPGARHVIGAVKVDYQLGVESADDVPSDLIAAILLMVGHWYENREASVIATNAVKLPMGVDWLLAPYSRAHVTA